MHILSENNMNQIDRLSLLLNRFEEVRSSLIGSGIISGTIKQLEDDQQVIDNLREQIRIMEEQKNRASILDFSAFPIYNAWVNALKS